MKRLTIGIDASRAFGARPTGTEHYASQVIGALAARAEHDYRLYFRGPPMLAPPADTDIRVLTAPRLWTHTRLALEVARHPPDVLFVPAHVLPLRCRVPAVVAVHDLGHRAWPGAHTLAQRLYLEWGARHHARHASHMIADSAATRDDLVRLFAVHPERVSVVHLGVDDDMQPAGETAVGAMRRQLGLPDDYRYFVHVGTLQPRKNLTRLVEAFAQLAVDRSDLWLVLAGRHGWGGEDPLRRAADLGVAERVRQLGYVARQLLPALYSGAEAAVVPSLHEGFGLTALEAMACGTPVVVSDSSSLPEVVGDAGLRFDPLAVTACAEALRRLLDEPQLRADLRLAGLRRAAGFSWERCAAGVQAVLEQVAAEAG